MFPLSIDLDGRAAFAMGSKARALDNVLLLGAS